MRRLVFGMTIVLIVSALIPFIAAHVPISAQDGETLETAFYIEDPTKSWVIYSELHEGAEPQYFAFEIEAEERIRMMLSIPVIADPDTFKPSIALMGPGLTNSSSIPNYLEIPKFSNVMIFESEQAVASYEGFTPTSFYVSIDFDIVANQTGKYHFAVYEPNDGGAYSIALGYVETFTLTEWVLVPFSVMIIHQWNGQSLLMILAPMIVILIFGVGILLIRKDKLSQPERAISWVVAVGAFLFFGSGAIIFFQMGLALLATVSLQIIVTLIFGLIPILLGIFTLRIALTENWQSQKAYRIRLLVIGIISPFLWAGLLLGPSLVIIGVLLTSVRRFTGHSTASV